MKVADPQGRRGGAEGARRGSRVTGAPQMPASDDVARGNASDIWNGSDVMSDERCGTVVPHRPTTGFGSQVPQVDDLRHPASPSALPVEDPLFRGFLESDATALEEVQEVVGRAIRFRGFGIPVEDRRDLAQEALLQVWREVSRPGFRLHESFRALVCVIAYRRCLDWKRLRHPSNPVESSIPDVRQGPEVDLLDRERVDLAYRAMRELPERSRELIRLHVQEDRSYREIASIQGRSEGAVRTQMWQCLKEARVILEKLRHPHEGPAEWRSR